jgi:starch-binding outer membrane protein, SusD/RagB family
MKTRKLNIIFLLSLFLVFFGCADLEIENKNNPDYAQAVSQPSDLRGIASGMVRTWYQISQEYDGPALGFWVMADAGTCSWGNAGMRVLSNQPRFVFDNNPTYADAQITENYYNTLQSLLSQANDVLKTIEIDGVEIIIGTNDDTPMVKAVSYFAQGLALGYLGLTYDQGFIVTQTTNLEEGVEISPWTELIDAALESFDQAIAISEANPFTLPAAWIPHGVAFTSANFSKLANSFAARILAYSPRSKAQNDALNWQKVYDYASKGIDYDFAPIADDINWYTLYQTYANYSGWGRTDMRVVSMMDPRMPSQWPAGGFNALPDPAATEAEAFDNRILTDFEYMDYNDFSAERGTYHFTCYRFARRDTYLSTWTEPCPEFYEAENDMLIAEALMHLDRLPEAQAVINAGTRVTRGGLPAVAATKAAIEAAIFHERNVELFNSGFGIEFFTMRKADKLQEGTFLHMPVPGAQLQVIGMPYYTFGANVGTPGVDVSNGGWF